MSESLIRRNAEGLTQNTIANMVTPYINPIVTGMVVWVLTKLETVSNWSAGSKIALIVGVAVVLTFLLHTLPILFRRRNTPDQLPSAPVVSESARLIELRDDLDAMGRDRDIKQTDLETCRGEYKQAVEDLAKCESLRRLEAGEVERVTSHYQEQVRLREQQIAVAAGKVEELEQRLRVAQATLDELAVPRGRLKIVKGRYWAVHPETNHMAEKDVTDVLDSRVVDERLTLTELYQVIFPEPMKHVKKKLTIDYLHNGRPFSITVVESTKITLPIPYD